MSNFAGGTIILASFLLMIFTLLFKWRKDYKSTGKLLTFVLYDKGTKYWIPIFIFLIALIILATLTSYSEPIQYQIQEWNPQIWEWSPWGWYG